MLMSSFYSERKFLKKTKEVPKIDESGLTGYN